MLFALHTETRSIPTSAATETSRLPSIRTCDNRIVAGLRAAAGLAVVALLASCTSIQVSSSHGQPNSIEEVETYAWLAPPADESAHLSEEQALKLRAEIDRSLELHGLEQVTPEQASVLVTYRTEIEVEQRFNDLDLDFYERETFEIGKLTIELLDAQRGACCGAERAAASCASWPAPWDRIIPGRACRARPASGASRPRSARSSGSSPDPPSALDHARNPGA